MDFGERVKALRESRGIIQEDFANYVGVSRPTVSGYETKGYQPSHEKLQRIAELFNVSIDYLINGGPMDGELELQYKYTKDQVRIILTDTYAELSVINKIKVLDYIEYLSFIESQELK